MTRKGIHNPIIADNIARGLRLSEDGEIILPSGKIHRTYGGKSRYLRVTLYSNGKKISVNKARILCWLHHGPPPTDEHEADHIDLNSRNDDPSNLRWATRSENTANISPEATAARKKWMRDRHAENKRKIAAHDELVTALKELLDAQPQESPIYNARSWELAIDAARAVLAKASA